MSKDLQYLIDKARKYRMTDAERQAQIKSLTYGNAHLENSTITKEHVNLAVEALDGCSEGGS